MPDSLFNDRKISSTEEGVKWNAFNNSNKTVLGEGYCINALIDKRFSASNTRFLASAITYANSGEVNFRLDQKDEAISALCERFIGNDSPVRVMDFDGRRIEFPDWWFNVRKSNTEPYLRIVAEASDSRKLDEKLDEIKSIIGKFH